MCESTGSPLSHPPQPEAAQDLAAVPLARPLPRRARALRRARAAAPRGGPAPAGRAPRAELVGGRRRDRRTRGARRRAAPARAGGQRARVLRAVVRDEHQLHAVQQVRAVLLGGRPVNPKHICRTNENAHAHPTAYTPPPKMDDEKLLYQSRRSYYHGAGQPDAVRDSKLFRPTFLHTLLACTLALRKKLWQ